MKIVHTMIRVNNLDESLKFYCDALGMTVLKKRD
ncbi:MAG: VOC family protein, partial [Candidatus Binatia bacterium]